MFKTLSCLGLFGRRAWFCQAALLACLACPVCSAWGEEFRVETEVFVGDSAEASGSTTTLFEKSAVYHFVDRPAQIVIYRRGSDSSASQFILLDLTKQQRTDVPLDHMESFVKKLTEWSAKQNDELPRFMANPQFEETFDATTGTLTLASPLWTYQVATTPAEQGACLLRYRDFIDSYARLNCMVHGEPPPGPRLALNAKLAERGLLPVEIRREVANEGEAARAAQMFSWRLSRADRDRLDDAREKIASFAKVTNEVYRQPPSDQISRK